jgi:hypothetical protein
MLNVAKARFLSNIVREFIKVAELNFTDFAARIANDMMVVRMMFNEFKAVELVAELYARNQTSVGEPIEGAVNGRKVNFRIGKFLVKFLCRQGLRCAFKPFQQFDTGMGYFEIVLS